MTVFVDTSALLAVLDADDTFHPRAGRIWERLLAGEDTLLTTNYIMLECLALVQARLGMAAVRTLERDITPALEVVWVDEELHRSGMAALLLAQRRQLSLVDCVSFEAMRRGEIREAFAFDRHFREQGFDLAN